MGGFQRVFEDAGGRVVKKLWPPLTAADYTPFIAQFGDVDAVVQGFAGSNPVKFMRQYADAGMKKPVIGGETSGDDALLKSFGDEAIGMINTCPYSEGLDNNGQVVEAGLQKTGGNASDKEALIKALRTVSLTDTPRGPISFDGHGN